MRNSMFHLVEMMVGGILFALALIYLTKQEKTLNGLVNVVNQNVLEPKEIYQQYKDNDASVVSSSELYAIVMGYREYPITINGYIVDANGENYEIYFSWIKKGSYQKNYDFDEDHEIIWVNYSYTGT